MRGMVALFLMGYGAFLGYQIRRNDLDIRAMEKLGDFWDNLNARAAREYLREIDLHEALKKNPGLLIPETVPPNGS